MCTTIRLDAENKILKVVIEGNLDLQLACKLVEIRELLEDTLSACVIDVQGVEHVFDSGVGILRLLIEDMTERGVYVVTRGDIPAVPRYSGVRRMFAADPGPRDTASLTG